MRWLVIVFLPRIRLRGRRKRKSAVMDVAAAVAGGSLPLVTAAATTSGCNLFLFRYLSLLLLGSIIRLD
jgi:hypothetical protein